MRRREPLPEASEPVPATAEPRHPRDYPRPLARASHGRTSPLEPDWLLARHLVPDVRRALRTRAGPAGRLLDLGCGGRPYQGAVPGGVRYVGMDTPASSLSRPDVWALASALPFGESAFDTVLCTQVLEHLAEPAAVLAEIARVLRPGGHLVLTAPQAWGLHEAPYDFFRFTRFGLEHLCRRVGLAPVEVRAQGGFFSSLGVFLVSHVGGYAEWAAGMSASRGRGAGGAVPHWRRWCWPLRLPMALVNLAFAALDALPQPGLFPLNHLVVAVKPSRAADGEDA